MAPTPRRSSKASVIAALLLPGVVLADPSQPASGASQPRAPAAAAVSLDEKGFVVSSADRAFQLRLGAVLQVDGRGFIGDTAPNLTDMFLVRTARPILEASLYELVDLRFMTDFGEGKAAILDAYADLRVRTWLKLRLGKFKPPIGLERLQSEQNTLFIERAFPTDLVPTRDVGAQVQGDVVNGALTYSLGVFNGAPDGAVGDDDTNESKDVVARIFLRPFRCAESGALKDVGIGVAASYGRQSGTAQAPNLPTFRTPSQQVMFSYVSAVVASGPHYRIVPQLHAYIGSFGLLSEYAISSQRVVRDTSDAQLTHRAWHVSTSYVVTGEAASYEGVVPSHPVRFAKGHPGAIEVAVRYEELLVDDNAFPTFADPTASVRRARAFDLGLNWFLTRNLRASINFDHTDFTGGAADGARQAENALLGRFQVAF